MLLHDNDRRLHTTLIYSRQYDATVQADRDQVHECAFGGYDLFASGKLLALVARLVAPTVEARHKQLMAEHALIYDFADYLPHVTLSYDFTGELASLPPITFPILLGEEYVEDLRNLRNLR
jgi:hypothetical protein